MGSRSERNRAGAGTGAAGHTHNHHYQRPSEQLEEDRGGSNSNSGDNEKRSLRRTFYWRRRSSLAKLVIILSSLLVLLLVIGATTIVVSYVACQTPFGLIGGSCAESELPVDSVDCDDVSNDMLPVNESSACEDIPTDMPLELLPTLQECGHPYTNQLVHESYQKRKKRVAGGIEVKKACAFPWMVKVLVESCYDDNVTFACGATLITKRYVLTSAHCAGPCANAVSVKLQNIDEPIKIEKSIPHPQYNRSCDCSDGSDDTYEEKNVYRPYDVALLRLEREVDVSIHSPVCLPLKKLYCLNHPNDLSRESQHFSAGWGYTSNDNDSDVSEHVNFLKLPLLTTRRCQAYFHNDTNITSRMTCAGAVEGEDMCSGDSGGPLFVGAKGRSFQVGVLSFGKKPCANGAPSVFININSYLVWILKSLEP